MLSVASPIDFVRSWRKREKLSQRDLAHQLGIGWARVGDFERGATMSLSFCVRFIAMLTEKEKLMFLDVLSDHMAVFKSAAAKQNSAAIKALRERNPLHELSDDDVYLTRLKGYRIEGSHRMKKRELGTIRKRRKKDT